MSASVTGSSAEHFDIVIAGGGLVGACAACALAAGPWRIAVVESRAPALSWPSATSDLRVSAISAASERIFRNIGVWDSMVARGVSPFREMEVWDAEGTGAVHFDAAEIGGATMGHIIENRVIQAALWERLDALSNVMLLCPATIADARLDGGAWSIQLGEQRTIRASLLIGADGVESKVRGFAHILAHGWRYDQHGVVANVTTEQPHCETAWQRFLPTGPLAFLPLSNGQCSIVWSTTPAHAAELVAMTDEAFCTAVAAAFEHKLGGVLATSPRLAFPLRLQYAERYVGPRVALIGDAAHAIHPLAGQGANLGFLDAAALAQVLQEAGSVDPGEIRALRRYERWRKGDNLLMMGVMDGFQRAFGSRAPAPVRWLRNVALGAADHAGPIKHLLMRRAMGLAGDLPEIAHAKSIA